MTITRRLDRNCSYHIPQERKEETSSTACYSTTRYITSNFTAKRPPTTMILQVPCFHFATGLWVWLISVKTFDSVMRRRLINRAHKLFPLIWNVCFRRTWPVIQLKISIVVDNRAFLRHKHSCLTYWELNKMADISHMIFSYIVFLYKFSLFIISLRNAMG